MLTLSRSHKNVYAHSPGVFTLTEFYSVCFFCDCFLLLFPLHEDDDGKKVYVYGSVNDLLAMKIKMHQQSCAKRNNIQIYEKSNKHLFELQVRLWVIMKILSSFYSRSLVHFMFFLLMLLLLLLLFFVSGCFVFIIIIFFSFQASSSASDFSSFKKNFPEP